MKKKCCACGYRFQPMKEAVYTAFEPQTVIQALAAPEKRFDVMDCPRCGCQNALAVRLPAAQSKIKESEAGDDETDL